MEDIQRPALPIQGKRIALIIDDGPLPYTTPQILTVLEKAQMHATFSLVGKNVAANPALAKQIVESGHEIANRTWSNYPLDELTPDQIRSEIRAASDAIVAATGVQPRYLRPPKGHVNSTIREIAREFGLQILTHSLDSGDWRNPPPGQVTKNVLAGVTPGAIVLTHESFPRTVSELPAIIEGLLQKGYRSFTISELQALSTGSRMANSVTDF